MKWPSDSDPAFKRALKVFTVSNAVPFVGALTLEKEVKLIVLCGNQPTAIQQAQSAQTPSSTATVQSPQAAPSTPGGTDAAPSSSIAQSCGPVPRFGFQLLVLAQSIFSALCFFFIRPFNSEVQRADFWR